MWQQPYWSKSNKTSLVLNMQPIFFKKFMSDLNLTQPQPGILKQNRKQVKFPKLSDIKCSEWAWRGFRKHVTLFYTLPHSEPYAKKKKKNLNKRNMHIKSAIESCCWSLAAVFRYYRVPDQPIKPEYCWTLAHHRTWESKVYVTMYDRFYWSFFSS